jgi:Acetyltransferase (GNAT) domain
MLDDYAARVAEGSVWVLEDAHGVVGVLVMLPQAGHLLLDNIAVAPERQGEGIGRRLLAVAEREALQRGFDELRLYTNAAMRENLGMYAKLGWEEYGRAEQAGYQRVFFRKRLDGHAGPVDRAGRLSPASGRNKAMAGFPITVSGGILAPGEAYLADTPVLRTHAGTQPDLFLRWNEMPVDAAAVDVVIHLHGFSRESGAMLLAEKIPRSGLDLSGRRRPTLALLPRGNWLRYSWYDHPALLAGGIDRLIEYGLAQFAAALPASPAAGLELDRLILTAHSGGGMPAVDAIADARQPPDELHLFDGLYGRDPATGDPMRGLGTIDRWLGERLAREPGRRGALRIVYIEQQTGPFSRRVGALISRHLEAPAPVLAADLRRRYRVEPSAVQHARIAQRCGPDLLAAADADFDWSR